LAFSSSTFWPKKPVAVGFLRTVPDAQCRESKTTGECNEGV
jgi:hypothetical protein